MDGACVPSSMWGVSAQALASACFVGLICSAAQPASEQLLLQQRCAVRGAAWTGWHAPSGCSNVRARAVRPPGCGGI